MPTDDVFIGQRGDATTGLDDYNARYYDPVVGQFTSADSDSAGGLNRYAYVGGNPETYTDPTGHLLFGGRRVVLPPRPAPVVAPKPAHLAARPAPRPAPPRAPVAAVHPAASKVRAGLEAHLCGASLACQFQTRCQATCQRLGDIQALMLFFEHQRDLLVLSMEFIGDLATVGLDVLNVFADWSMPTRAVGIVADIAGVIADVADAVNVGIQLFGGVSTGIWNVIAGTLHWLAWGFHVMAAIAGVLSWIGGLNFVDEIRNLAEKSATDFIQNISFHLLTSVFHFSLGFLDIHNYELELKGESLAQLQQECSKFSAC